MVGRLLTRRSLSAPNPNSPVPKQDEAGGFGKTIYMREMNGPSPEIERQGCKRPHSPDASRGEGLDRTTGPLSFDRKAGTARAALKPP